MDELRVIRRENDALILTNDVGEEFRLVVDEVASAEFRQITRRPASTSTVRPREIQALLRAGMSRAEVSRETGADEADVERFEEPVRAEQRYILELANAVPVRTDPHGDVGSSAVDQRFGEVIADRLIGLGSTGHEWRSWRDPESGWHVGLLFFTRDTEHDAIWSFDHRKRVLAPISADAVHLSKAGDVGDQLIPKLRAVDNAPAPAADHERGDDQENFGDATSPVPVQAAAEPDGQPEGSPDAENATAADVEALANLDAEYERRREIDQLAVNTPAAAQEDLSQTADLLDALRKRRGERAAKLEQEQPDAEDAFSKPSNMPIPSLATEVLGASSQPKKRPSAATNIWGAAGVSADDDFVDDIPAKPSGSAAGRPEGANNTEAAESAPEAESPQRSAKPNRRGRSSIPSWDDILFGTRSEDDPS